MIKQYLLLLLGFSISIISCSDKSTGTSTNTGTTIAKSNDSTLHTDEPLTIKIVNNQSDTNTLSTTEVGDFDLQSSEFPKNESFKLKLHYEFRRAYDYELIDNKLEASLIDSGTIINNNIFWNNDSLDYPCVLTLSTNLGQNQLSKVFYNIKDLQSSPDLFSLKNSVKVEVNPINIPLNSTATWIGFLGSSYFTKLSEASTLINSGFSDLSKLIVINDFPNSTIASFNPDTSLSTRLISTQSTIDNSYAKLQFSTSQSDHWEIEFTIIP
ncbi:hypothetical protein OAA91_01280 [Fibrobacterales bacterium]|nr:hypothetical protein [Fibrobacterales bacterium]